MDAWQQRLARIKLGLPKGTKKQLVLKAIEDKLETTGTPRRYERIYTDA